MHFLCVKIIYNTVLQNVSSILQCKYCVYLCIDDLFHILLYLWQTYGSMECMHVCMYVSHRADNVPPNFLTVPFLWAGCPCAQSQKYSVLSHETNAQYQLYINIKGTSLNLYIIDIVHLVLEIKLSTLILKCAEWKTLRTQQCQCQWLLVLVTRNDTKYLLKQVLHMSLLCTVAD